MGYIVSGACGACLRACGVSPGGGYTPAETGGGSGLNSPKLQKGYFLKDNLLSYLY